jgi:hypothetical protein
MRMDTNTHMHMHSHMHMHMHMHMHKKKCNRQHTAESAHRINCGMHCCGVIPCA